MRKAMIALTAALALATSAAAQEGSEGAAQFVRTVFALYDIEDGPWPIDDTVLDQVWSAEMAVLIRRDRELATEDLPYLDADPVCNCQDAEGLTVQAVNIQRAHAGTGARRRAVVSFVNGGEPQTTVLDLVGGPGAWRIGDVVNPHGYPGLKAVLNESNARIEAGGRAAYRD